MMTPMTILAFSLLFTLAIGVPIWLCLGMATFLAMLATDIPLSMIVESIRSGVDNFPLLAVPCFVLAGNLMERGEITKQIIDVMLKAIGHVPGGLGIATIFSCMFFASITGSSPATVAAIGSMMIPAMIKRGYSKEHAGGVACSGGVLGILIPPSNPMIVYGVIANVSITGLFMAGFLPGIIVTISLVLVAYLVAKRNGYVGSEEKFNFIELLHSINQAKFALAMPFLILGGIYGGVFTAVEASVMSVIYALVVGACVTRKLTLHGFFESLHASHIITGSLLIIIGTSVLFGRMVVMYNLPDIIAVFIGKIATDKYTVLLLVIAFLGFVGLWMETLSTIVILTPILLPLVTKWGVDPIHFGIIFVITNEMALLTPPVGQNLFVASILADIPIESLFRTVMPYLLALIVVAVIIVYFPDIVLILPRLLLG